MIEKEEVIEIEEYLNARRLQEIVLASEVNARTGKHITLVFSPPSDCFILRDKKKGKEYRYVTLEGAVKGFNNIAD